MGEHLDAADRYMRLALKAQGQCRASIETLAAIKNPPVVFARQANINNGGNQQVNNGAPAKSAQYAQAGARTEDSKIEQTELLEASDGERLDDGAMRKASSNDSGVAAVGAIDGAVNPSR